ncbi:conserved hypothetical protein [Leishmania infantum JPCM5]|uniref:Uncharacterized protein n=2 Tax=Leishmania infantum TaxID=5671 RepID=A4IB38_LEIIN|nr:conserved hypothetical protein [Leishmania infantum JPCM5]CAC9543916.1 hypothetical_protein_-_conserved [Leishmania infantum]CAM72052.1 conserved hypothetical protein [Leishmania infantum JPCM5]SUZ45976.1 hypothetical_protein_-_conserved [Leishmania infantum]|eukprot:XP_001468957.1 conserved hypothetical protein [Leishmania infantum JPCM5]
MLSTLRIPVHEEPEEEEVPASPDPYATSPFRGASPSIVSMVRAGSISSENMPPPPDIQHIEGQLWFVTGKNGPGKKHASAQWVVCEDQRLSVYSSWANSSRLVEEARFERVRILFDFLHPHRHPEVMGSGAPQTRRMTIHRNESRTTAESRYAFHIRDPCDAKTLAGYYYFGVECVMRDPLTVRLRRSLAVFCTDHPEDHRKWLDFWEEMQVRYPMLRNRNAAAMSMDISSELMSEFVFPPQAVKPVVGGKSEEDTDLVSSPGLPSPIGRDEDSLATTRAPKWTDSEHGQPHWKGCTQPLPFASLGSTSADGVRGSLLGDVAAGGEDAKAGGSEQWLALLVDAERQAREGIELIEAATRSVLEANQALRDLFHHVAPTATVPSPVAAVCSKDEGSAGDDAASGVPMRDGGMMRALQAELRALCTAFKRAKSRAFTSAPAPETLIPAESTAVANQVLLAAYERELEVLRAQNATLRRELDTHAATAAARVERALGEWTLTSTVDIVVSDAENGGDGHEVADASADRQRYLAADEALVRALVEAALVQESSTAAFDSSGGAASSAQVNTQGESASTPQASHATLSTDADGYGGVISAGRLLSTASDSRQLCRAHSGEAQLSDATSAAGDLAASLPALVQQHLSAFATEHGRRLGSTDLARSLSTDRDSLLYHVVDEVVTAFKDLIDAPHIATDISKAAGNAAASAPTATAVSSWLSVLHRCLLHRLGVAGVVCGAGTSNQSSLAAAEVGGPATDAASAVEAAAAAGDDVAGCCPPAEASSNARQSSSLPPLTDEEIAIVGDLHHSAHDVVAWILDLLGERQRYAAYVTALDSLTCRHDVFRPLKAVQGELERVTARCEAAAAAASPSSAACGPSEATNSDTFPLEAAAVSSADDDDPEDSEKHTADGSDGLKVERRLTARLQHAMAAFDSKCEEAAALRRLLTAILYGSEMALRKADSTDEVVSAAMTSAAAACEAFRAAQEAGVGEVDKLRGAAEACVAARAREEVWASTLTPAVLQACADALIGAPCIQDMVHALQLTLGRCPEIHGRPRWVGGAAYVPPLSQESIGSLAQELHQRLAVEQARCNGLLGEVMLISSSLACVGSEPLTAAYSTAMTATANASAMTNEAVKAWAAYTKHACEVVPGQQRDLHKPVETKSDPCLSAAPAETTAETAPHEAVHARLVAALSRADGARGLRSAAFDATNSLLPNLFASIAGTQTALWRLVGALLRHGAGAGVPSPEVLLALPIAHHIAAPHAIGDSEADVSSLGVHIGVAASAAEELLSECEKAASEHREWTQQLLQWLKDFPPAYTSDAAPEPASELRYDASTAHEVYAQLLEELAAAESEHMSRVGAVEALLWKTSCVRTISVPELSDGAGDADIAALAAAAAADIAEALRVSDAHVSVTAASVDPVQRAVHVSATIAHHPRGLTRASVLGAIHACPFARLQEALKGAPVDSAATASDTGERSTAHPATADSPEGIDAVSQLARSLQHRAAKMAAVAEFEKRVLALLPRPQDIAMASAGMPTIDATPACKAVQALAAMLADELDIQIPEANFKRPSTASAALLDSLASYLEQLHDAALLTLHHRRIESGYASLEKLRAAVDALHDAALEKVADAALEQISPLHNIIDMPWPEALKAADLRHIHLIIEHLASGADRAASPDSTDDQFNNLRVIAQALGVPPDAYAGERDGECVPTTGQLAERAGAVVSARAEETAGLRAIAQALGVPPDAYAGERDGECVPTTGQLAERAGAVVSARAEETAGLRAIAQALGVPPDAYAGEWTEEMTPRCSEVLSAVDALVKRSKMTCEAASMDAGEGEAAVGVLVTLWEAVEEAGVVTADLEDGWWSVEGRSRWEAAARLVGALSAAVEVSREELADVSERIKLFEDELVDVERDHNESRETITAAVEKLRGGLEEVIIEDPGEMSPPSSRGSTVCGPLFTSLRQLTSEVSDVANVLRRVKQVLEEHNAEEKCMPELEEVSFPVPQQDGCDVLEAGKVLTYEDVVAGVRAKVVALRKERARRIETDAALKNFLSAVTDRSTFSEEQPVPRPSLLMSRRCVKPKAKPQPADLESSVSEEFSLPRTPLHLSTNSGNTDAPLGCSGSISVPVSRWATSEVLEKVRHQMNQAENAIVTLRVAVAAAYEALGGEDDVVHVPDNEAARLLLELAQNTAESIVFVKRLLEPLEESEASTGRREQLAHLVDRIKEKLGSSSGASMPTLLQAMEEGMHSMYNESTSSRRSPGSSVNRHLPRKQKPVAPEVEFTKGFHLTQQVVRNRDSSASSLTSTLKVLAPPPPGPRDSTEDMEKEIGYRMQELDALRRGCSVALRTLDSSLNVSDMDCNAMIMHLVERCSDVQTAMQITDVVFEDDDIISEVSAAASSYRASNPPASEHPLPMRCSVLVRAVKSLDNLCESMRHTQANMAKQQRFLMHNETQNTGELRRALVELEQQLHNGNAERLELQKAKEAAEKNAAELSHALEMAHKELTNLQNVRDDLERSLMQFKQQHAKDDELDRADEKLNSLNHAKMPQVVLEAATDAVRTEVLGPCQQLHLAVVGREMPKSEMLAEGEAQEVLLPALHAIAKALQNAVEEMTRLATGDMGIAALLAEERKHAAQRAAALKSELASVAEAKEEAEARAKAAAKHLKQAEDAFEDEVAKLKRALRNSEAMLEDKEANHQRRLRQAQAAAEDQLALVQQRLDRATRAQTEEERLRAASEENVQKLRGALAEVESELSRQQRYAAEDTMTQRKGSMQRIDSLEADLAAARLHSSELAQALGRARRDSAEAARALEAEAREKAKLAEELADTLAQLRAANNELASICASIASTGLTSSIKSSASSPASPERATELVAGLVDHVAVLQRALEAQETARQQHRTKGTQSEDAVAETLAAFAAIWTAAVKTGCTPARLNEGCLTPMDKAKAVSNALTSDVSPQLDDLAATRQRLLNLLCHPRVRHLERSAALGPLEKATTAALVQTYHDAMEGCYEAQQAALERELRDAQCKVQSLLARLQEQEELHAMEAAEVEIRIGRMREMVQSKLMADEIAEQHMRETDAAVRAHFVL